MEGKSANAGPHKAIDPMAMDNGPEKSTFHHPDDSEKQAAPEFEQLQRKLKSRHLQFVAIGMSLLLPYRQSYADSIG